MEKDLVYVVEKYDGTRQRPGRGGGGGRGTPPARLRKMCYSSAVIQGPRAFSHFSRCETPRSVTRCLRTRRLLYSRDNENRMHLQEMKQKRRYTFVAPERMSRRKCVSVRRTRWNTSSFINAFPLSNRRFLRARARACRDSSLSLLGTFELLNECVECEYRV